MQYAYHGDLNELLYTAEYYDTRKYLASIKKKYKKTPDHMSTRIISKNVNNEREQFLVFKNSGETL